MPSTSRKRKQTKVTDADVLMALKQFVAKQKRSPSTRELAAWLDVTAITISRHLQSLERKGLVTYDGTRSAMPVEANREGRLEELLRVVANIAHWADSGSASVILEPVIAEQLKEFKAK